MSKTTTMADPRLHRPAKRPFLSARLSACLRAYVRAFHMQFPPAKAT